MLNLILEVSDDKNLPKHVRKQRQIEHAPHLSQDAKLIKIADKISNIKDVTYSPPPKWPLKRRIGYLDWAEGVVNGVRGCNAGLEKCFDELLAECREKFRSEREKLMLDWGYTSL